MRVGQGVYAQISNRAYSDWVYWYSRSWECGGWNQSQRSCCLRKEGTGRRQRSTGNSTSTTRTTAETTERGRKDTSWNWRGCTSCPRIRQAQTHIKNPALCDQHEQAFAGEAGSVQCKHPKQKIWWDPEEGGKKWNNGQGPQPNGLKQSYNFSLLRFTLVRSSATTTTYDLSYPLAYHRWPVESCTWNQGNMRVSRKVCWNSALREEEPRGS